MTPEILERIRSADDLPTLPTVAIEVLKLAQADDVSLADIAGVIQQDPALAGKLLKVVNSSLFGLSRQVSSLQQAMVVLGLRTVKVMVLSFSLVEEMDKDQACDFDYRGYWRRSLTTAVTARLIAETCDRSLADEAFVTGLLCDIGMLAAVRQAAALYAPVLEALTDRQDVIQTVEQEMLGATHEAIGAELLSHWGLPETLCAAVGGHHAPAIDHRDGNSVTTRLNRITRAAARIADVFCSEHEAGRIDAVRDETLRTLRLSESELQTVLEAIDQHVNETASTFALDIEPTQNYQALRAKAAAQLVQLGMAAELERAQIAEREQAARRQVEELNDQNRELAQQARTDSLTGLANRAALDHYLEHEAQRKIWQGTPLGVVLIDLDRFKSLNDMFGHPSGDLALKLVGACLKGFADDATFVARYGGEEFATVISGALPAGVRQRAESIRAAIERIRVPVARERVPITASVGATIVSANGPRLPIDRLVKLADHCLYEAKRTGRNRVVFMLASEAVQLLPSL